MLRIPREAGRGSAGPWVESLEWYRATSALPVLSHLGGMAGIQEEGKESTWSGLLDTGSDASKLI